MLYKLWEAIEVATRDGPVLGADTEVGEEGLERVRLQLQFEVL
jgi:hypothetical protein